MVSKIWPCLMFFRWSSNYSNIRKFLRKRSIILILNNLVGKFITMIKIWLKKEKMKMMIMKTVKTTMMIKIALAILNNPLKIINSNKKNTNNSNNSINLEFRIPNSITKRMNINTSKIFSKSFRNYKKKKCNNIIKFL